MPGHPLYLKKIGFKVKPLGFLGICTSSSSVGHSISFGKSDATIVLAESSAIADAAATSIGNSAVSVESGLEFAKKFMKIIDGVMIINKEKVGKLGRLPEIIELE